MQAEVPPAAEGASAAAALNEGSHCQQTVLTFDTAASGAVASRAPINAAAKSMLGTAADEDDITSCVTPDLGLHACRPDEDVEAAEADPAVSPNPKNFSFFLPARQKKV